MNRLADVMLDPAPPWYIGFDLVRIQSFKPLIRVRSRFVWIELQEAVDCDIERFAIGSDRWGSCMVLVDKRRLKRARRTRAKRLKALIKGFSLLDAHRGYLVRHVCA